MKAVFPELSKLSKAVKVGALWSLLLIVGRQLISLFGTAILSRILSPEDYGLIGMVTTITALFLVFSDLGLTTTVIQKTVITENQLNNLYWINIIFGSLIWILISSLSPLISWFYGREELVLVTVICGSLFFISSLSAQPLAILRKRIASKEITKIELVALFVGTLSGIIAAFSGLGYWSLVVQSVIKELTKTIIVLVKFKVKLRKFKFNSGTIPLFYFGLSLTINGVIIYFSRNLDNILVGKFWGASELGNYNRAYFLMLLPSMLANGVATNLMVPALSAVNQDTAKFGASYRKALFMISLIGCPISLGLSLTSHEFVNFIYGEGWEKVVILIQYLGLASFTQPLYNTTGWLFTASGQTKQYLTNTVVSFVLVAFGFLFTTTLGVEAMAISYSIIVSIPVLIFAFFYSHKASGILVKDSITTILPILTSNLFMFIVLYSFNKSTYIPNLYFSLLSKVVLGVVSYILALKYLLPKEKKVFISNHFKLTK